MPFSRNLIRAYDFGDRIGGREFFTIQNLLPCLETKHSDSANQAQPLRDKPECECVGVCVEALRVWL